MLALVAKQGRQAKRGSIIRLAVALPNCCGVRWITLGRGSDDEWRQSRGTRAT